jgi:putative membrane protein
VVYLNNQNKSTKAPERAIDILENAYARGEISREEFLQKREDLLGKNG